MTAPPPAWQVWSALSVVYVVWGSTYLAIAYVVRSLPSLLSAGARFGTAALLLAAYLLVRRGPRALAATRRQWRNAAGIGVLLLLGGNGLVTLGEERELPSGLAALLVAGVPFWVVLLRRAAGERPAGRTVLGVVIGFAGVAVLLLPGARPSGVPLVAAVMVVSSSVLWSTGSFLAGRTELPRDPLVTTLAQMCGGCLALTAAGLVRGEDVDPGAWELASVVGWGYLVVFGSLVAFTAYSWLLGVAPVSQVATYAYVNPLVAVLLGAAFLSEPLTATALIGGAVTVLAVAVVVSEEGRRRRQDAPVGDLAAPAQDPEDLQGRSRSSLT